MFVSSRAAFTGARAMATATVANARLAGPAADVPLTARSASATDAAACFRTLGLESTQRLEMAPKALAQCGHSFVPGSCASLSAATSCPMHRTTPLSATGFSCAARPVLRSTCIAWGNRLSTGPVGACSSATPSTVSIAALVSGFASVSVRSRDDSDAANTAVGDGLIPSALRMDATASSTAVTCFESADEDIRCLSYSSATGSPVSKPSSSTMSSDSRHERPTYCPSELRALCPTPWRRSAVQKVGGEVVLIIFNIN